MNMYEKHQQRLSRYSTLMRNEKPDCVPIRPFVAEFAAKVAGFTNLNVIHLATVTSLMLAMTAIGLAEEVSPQVPLRAPDGPVVALWQKTPNPNKPYIAQLYAPGEKPVPLLEDSPADHFHHHALMQRVSTGDWCAVRNTIEGRPVTVLMIAHAANPRPGEWFTMSEGFCYLSATLNLEKNPFSLAKGQRWTLRYSLAVLSTPADHARLAEIVAAF
jgi:hypothetical protein